MTTVSTVIEDSISPEGIRLTTFANKNPRMIHSEFMTHRVISRNASSSRAIPVQKQIANILADPAEPSEWGSNQRGMQAGEDLTGWRLRLTKIAWHGAKHATVIAARLAIRAGAHKQIANRMLEPWSHISSVVTATDYANWFALRDHDDADPTIRELALAMKYALDGSTPKLLQPGEWHLPYITALEREQYGKHLNKDGTPFLARLSAARCARVSFLTHGGRIPAHADDIRLWEQLVDSQPVHASPTEHQATPDKKWTRDRWGKPQEHGNFRGWRQHRKMIPGEAVPG